MNIDRLRKVQNFARDIEYSTVHVYDLIKKGLIESVNIDGAIFIDIDKVPKYLLKRRDALVIFEMLKEKNIIQKFDEETRKNILKMMQSDEKIIDVLNISIFKDRDQTSNFLKEFIDYQTAKGDLTSLTDKDIK